MTRYTSRPRTDANTIRRPSGATSREDEQNVVIPLGAKLAKDRAGVNAFDSLTPMHLGAARSVLPRATSFTKLPEALAKNVVRPGAAT